MWEYRFEHVRYSIKDDLSLTDKASMLDIGQDGWEAVSMVAYREGVMVILFKRRVQQMYPYVLPTSTPNCDEDA